ncbi:hypothetical protein GCM10023169_20750 [Georgenia halophila]|uniref:HNH nuclease domain-containing protein n=1 Tax=Georgenia halophila TaxID=620889 RepID=A0ABP8L8J7_9MICO
MATDPAPQPPECCTDPFGPCEHERALVRRLDAEMRMARAADVARMGIRGVVERADAGDPWADEVLADLFGGIAPDEDGAAYAPDKLPVDPLADEFAAEVPDGSAPAVLTMVRRESPQAGDCDEAGFDATAFSRVLRGEYGELVGKAHDDQVSASFGVGLVALASMPAGPELAAALAGVDMTQLGRAALVEVMAAFKRLESQFAGQAAQAAAQLAATSQIHRHPTNGRKFHAAGEEIAMRLAVSRREASRMVRVGAGLGDRFSETGAALAAGAIDYRKAETIVTTLDGSSAPVAWTVEHDVLDRADGRTRGQIETDLHDSLVSVDPEDARLRHTRARSRRRVERTRVLPDGMGSITAVLPAGDCVLVDKTLDAVAHAAHSGGDVRSTDQLRADTLVALTRAAIHTGRTGHHAEMETDSACWDAISASLDDNPAATAECGTGSEDAPARHGEGGAHAEHPARTEVGTDASETGESPAAPQWWERHSRPQPHDTDSGPQPDGGGQAPAESDTGAGRTADDGGNGQTIDVPPGVVPDVAVISPLLMRLLRDPSERLGVPKPQIRVTVPFRVLVPPHKDAEPGDVAADNGQQQGAASFVGTTLPTETDSPGHIGRVPADRGTSVPAGQREGATVRQGSSPSAERQNDRSAQRASDEAIESTSDLPGIGTRESPSELAAILDAASQEVAVLAGYGPIDDVEAQALAAGGVLRRMLTDPITNVPIELGRRRYRPPQALQDLVRARDRTCARPGCTVPAEDCEIDHTIAWSAGGETGPGNNKPLCGRDHLLKTVGAMRVRQPKPGIFLWTTATGHTYRRERDGTITLIAVDLPDEERPGDYEGPSRTATAGDGQQRRDADQTGQGDPLAETPDDLWEDEPPF